MKRLTYLLISLVLPLTVAAETIHVPGDRPTIQAALYAALEGDTILVGDGIYSARDGFRDIDFLGRRVVLTSENGPEATIIDCEGTLEEPHRGVIFHSGEDTTSVLQGFTIRNGYGPFDGPNNRCVGGAVFCDSASSPLIKDCIFENGTAWDGGAVHCYYSAPIIRNCTMHNNLALNVGGAAYAEDASPRYEDCRTSGNVARNAGGFFFMRSDAVVSGCTVQGDSAQIGGAVYVSDCSPLLTGCDFRDNRAEHGGVLSGGTPVLEYSVMFNNAASDRGGCIYNSDTRMTNCTLVRNTAPNGLIRGGSMTADNCILAFNIQGYPIEACAAVFTCSNLFENGSGDWVGMIADQAETNDNFSIDPQFCDTANGELYLWYLSPCLAENSPCGLVGALELGCDGIELPVPGAISYCGGAQDYAVRTLTPEINWIYTDTAATVQAAYEIEVGTDQDWTEAELWTTGAVLSSDTFALYEGEQLADRSTYYTRIRLQSESGWGSWRESRLLTRLPQSDPGPSDWTTFQCNVQRTGYNDRDRITVPLSLNWARQVRPYAVMQPTVIGQRLVWSGRVVPWPQHIPVQCVDSNTGDSLWGYSYLSSGEADFLTQASYGYGMVYYQVVHGTGSKVWAVDVTSGEVQWLGPFRTQFQESLAPAVDNHKVVIPGGTYGGMYCYDAITGYNDWFTPLGQLDYWAPSVYQDTIYLFAPLAIIAYDLHTGGEIRRKSTGVVQWPGMYDIGTAPVIDTTTESIYCSDAWFLHALDMISWELLWQDTGDFGHEGLGINVAVYGGNVFAVESHKLAVYDGRSGDTVWTLPGYYCCYPPAIANGLVFISCDTLTAAIDISNREVVWKCRVGGEMAIANNSLYIATVDGWIYCYGPMPTGVEDDPDNLIPTTYALAQNYPNPFNLSTTIEYTLPIPAEVSLTVYNVLGQQVTTLYEGPQPAGRHVIEWDGRNTAGRIVSSGIYFYRLHTPAFTEAKKMVLVK